MLELEKLTEIQYIQDNLKEIHTLNKATGEALELLKEDYKSREASFEDDTKEIIYSYYNKFYATDLREIMKKYPIEEHEDMYSISISKIAPEIIMEPELLTTMPIKKVTFKFK